LISRNLQDGTRTAFEAGVSNPPIRETRAPETNAALLLQLVEGLLGEVERLAAKQAATEAELKRMGAKVEILAAELTQHYRSCDCEGAISARG
jgi:hypothetical protein